MQMNDFHIQLATALPGGKRVSTRKGNTIHTDIITEHDGRQRAYVKLLSVQDIAKEALCAVLARKLYLPIKQPFYVDTSGIEYPNSKDVHKVAFGLLDDQVLSFHIRNIDDSELLKWEDLLRCAVFDEWVANPDRLPNNLIYEGNQQQFWLIDHDEAFANYILANESINSQLLQLMAKGKAEFELHKIRNDALKYVAEYELIDWDEIYSLLLVENIRGSAQYYRKYIKFLKQRISEMRSIISNVLGIRQNEISFVQKVSKRNIKR